VSRTRPGMARVRRHLRWELAWLLVAAGVGGLMALALDAWVVPDRHRWDVVAAAVALTALGLGLLAAPGARAARPRCGPGRRPRAARGR
jgi:hypothetical protein